MSECNHAVGTATVEYSVDMLLADDNGGGASEYSFEAFNYCPYCGENVDAEANLVAERIRKHWEKFWVGYGEQHGSEELRRARKLC